MGRKGKMSRDEGCCPNRDRMRENWLRKEREAASKYDSITNGDLAPLLSGIRSTTAKKGKETSNQLMGEGIYSRSLSAYSESASKSMRRRKWMLDIRYTHRNYGDRRYAPCYYPVPDVPNYRSKRGSYSLSMVDTQ